MDLGRIGAALGRHAAERLDERRRSMAGDIAVGGCVLTLVAFLALAAIVSVVVGAAVILGWIAGAF